MKIGREIAIRTMTEDDAGVFGFIERDNAFVPGMVLTDTERRSIGTLLMDRENTAVKGTSSRFIPVPDAFIDFDLPNALAVAYNWDIGNLVILDGLPMLFAQKGGGGTLVDLKNGTLVGDVDWHGALLCSKWRVICPPAGDKLTTLYSSY